MIKKLITNINTRLHRGDYYCNNCKKWVSARKNIFCPTCFTTFTEKYNIIPRKLRLLCGDRDEFLAYGDQVFVNCGGESYKLMRYGDRISFTDSNEDSKYTEWEKNASAQFVQFSKGIFTIKIFKNGEVMSLDVIHDKEVRTLNADENMYMQSLGVGDYYYISAKKDKENTELEALKFKKLPENIVCFDLKNCIDLALDDNRIFFATLENTNTSTGEREYKIYKQYKISDEDGMIWKRVEGRSKRVLSFLSVQKIKTDFGDARKAKQIKVPVITPKAEELMLIKEEFVIEAESFRPCSIYRPSPRKHFEKVTKIIYTPTVIKGDGMFIPDKI